MLPVGVFVSLDEQVEVDAKQGFYRKGIVGNDSLGGCSTSCLSASKISTSLAWICRAMTLPRAWFDQGEAQVGLKVTAPTRARLEG